MTALTNTTLSGKFYQSLRIPFYCICVIWGIHIIKLLLGVFFAAPDALVVYGILPRDIVGLRGVLFAPLLHGDFAHLISNSIPLFVLFSLIIYFYQRVAIRSFIMIYLLTGLAVWLLAGLVQFDEYDYGTRYHIGASGVVYGLVTFLLGNGIFRRNGKSIVIALIILFFYSGIFAGIIPDEDGKISWESHLYGALVGLFTAFFYKEEVEEDEVKEEPSWAHEVNNKPQQFFLERDAFEKTKAERQREKDDDDFLGGWTSSSTWEES